MNNLQQMELLEQEQECFLGNLYEQSSAVFMDLYRMHYTEAVPHRDTFVETPNLFRIFFQYFVHCE